MSRGFVYIFTNEAYRNCIKIGYTEHTIEDRLKQLSSSTGVLCPFKCYATYEVDNPKDVEGQIQKKLDKYRINKNREFFKITPEEAYEIFSMHCTFTGNNDNCLKLYQATSEQPCKKENEEIQNPKKRQKPEISAQGIQIRPAPNQVSREDMISEVREIADKLGKKTVTMAEFNEYSTIRHSSRVVKKFNGWDDFLTQAGLEPSCSPVNMTRDDVLDRLRAAIIDSGDPDLSGKKLSEMNKKNHEYVSDSTCKKHFGSYPEAKRLCWDSIRKDILKIDGYACRRCGASTTKDSAVKIDVYQNLESEKPEEKFITLCPTCWEWMYGNHLKLKKKYPIT